MYVDLDHCLVCDGKDLEMYLDFGVHPPANSYTDVPTGLECAPLQLMFCKNCSHSQLSTITDPEILFSNYLYVSGTTETLRKHFASFAQDCLSRFGEGKSVLEIGCNDGSCLKAMMDVGFHGVGVDPATNLASAQAANGVTIHRDFWSMNTNLSGTFDIIYGMNVFAHNLKPLDFLKRCLMAMTPGGTLILEMPYSLNMFRITDFGQVYSEHQQFFNVSSMHTLLKRVGMAIVDVTESNVHGGSIRFFIQHAAPTHYKALNMIRTEKNLGMGDIAFYEKFKKNVIMNINLLNQALIAQVAMGFKVIGYGAAAKLSTLVSSLGAEAIPLVYVVDDNPLKCGKYLPNTDIEILPTSVLETEQDKLCILFGAHNFKEEIQDRLRRVRTKDQNDVCLHWVPKVEIDDLYWVK